MKIKDITKKHLNKKVEINGWVRFNRISKNIGFLTVFDGSNLDGIQVVYKGKELYDKLSKVNNWSGISINGNVVEGNNGIEIVVESIYKIWNATEEHKLGKKTHGLEFLREVAHLRSKTKFFQAVMKIRSIAAQATHDFFSNNVLIKSGNAFSFGSVTCWRIRSIFWQSLYLWPNI